MPMLPELLALAAEWATTWAGRGADVVGAAGGVPQAGTGGRQFGQPEAGAYLWGGYLLTWAGLVWFAWRVERRFGGVARRLERGGEAGHGADAATRHWGDAGARHGTDSGHGEGGGQGEGPTGPTEPESGGEDAFRG